MLSNIDFGSYFHTKKYEKGLSTGGDKIADWGGSKGGWGGHVPPSLYVKRGPGNRVHISAMPMKTTMIVYGYPLYGYLLQVSGYYVYERV